MPSARRSRALRNAAPPHAQRRADPHVLVAAASVVVVAAVAAVLGITLTRSAKPHVPRRLPGAADAVALYRGIPQHGLTLGSRTAKVHLVEYVDLQCPVCREFETTVG